jgi:hypothetical protein
MKLFNFYRHLTTLLRTVPKIKKTIFFVLFLLFIKPGIAIAAACPNTSVLPCDFQTLFLYKNKEVAPQKGKNKLYNNVSSYVNDGQGGYARFIFQFDTIPQDCWNRFPRDTGSTQPKFLSQPLKIVWKEGTNPFDQTCEDEIRGPFNITSWPRYETPVDTCNVTIRGQHTVILKYKDGNDYKPLCSGTYSVEDEHPSPDANITITPLDQQQDPNTVWDVVIQKVIVPNSWSIETDWKGVFRKIGVWLNDGINEAYWGDIKDKFEGYNQLPFTLGESPINFKVKLLEGGRDYSLTLKTLGPDPTSQNRVIKSVKFHVYNIGEPVPTPTVTPSITPFPFSCDYCDSWNCSNPDDDCVKYGCPRCGVTPRMTMPPTKPPSTPIPPAPSLGPICEQINVGTKDKPIWPMVTLKEKCKCCMDPKSVVGCKEPAGIWTAVGCLPRDYSKIVSFLFSIGVGIAGGIAFLFFLFGAFMILTSAGNAEQIEEGKQTIISALSGLLLIIFSIFLLTVIGVDILHIPGLSK